MPPFPGPLTLMAWRPPARVTAASPVGPSSSRPSRVNGTLLGNGRPPVPGFRLHVLEEDHPDLADLLIVCLVTSVTSEISPKDPYTTFRLICPTPPLTSTLRLTSDSP